jgi:hypothetical protein
MYICKWGCANLVITYPYNPKASCTQIEIARILATLIVNPKNVDWDPEEQHIPLGEGFIVPLLNKDALMHDALSSPPSQHNHNQEL